jgi:hypothetical protein
LRCAGAIPPVIARAGAVSARTDDHIERFWLGAAAEQSPLSFDKAECRSTI